MRAANLPSILAPPGRTALVQRVLHALAGWRSYPRVKRDAAAADRSCLSLLGCEHTHVDSRPRGGGQHVGGTHTMSFLRRWTRSPITGHVWTVWVCFAGPFRPRTVSVVRRAGLSSTSIACTCTGAGWRVRVCGCCSRAVLPLKLAALMTGGCVSMPAKRRVAAVRW